MFFFQLFFFFFLSLAIYAFAYNKAGSKDLWKAFKEILKETGVFLDERNLILSIYSFCKMNISDNDLWEDCLEKIIATNYINYKLVNQILIVHSFSKLNKGKNNI